MKTVRIFLLFSSLVLIDGVPVPQYQPVRRFGDGRMLTLREDPVDKILSEFAYSYSLDLNTCGCQRPSERLKCEVAISNSLLLNVGCHRKNDIYCCKASAPNENTGKSGGDRKAPKIKIRVISPDSEDDEEERDVLILSPKRKPENYRNQTKCSCKDKADCKEEHRIYTFGFFCTYEQIRCCEPIPEPTRMILLDFDKYTGGSKSKEENSKNSHALIEEKGGDSSSASIEDEIDHESMERKEGAILFDKVTTPQIGLNRSTKDINDDGFYKPGNMLKEMATYKDPIQLRFEIVPSSKEEVEKTALNQTTDISTLAPPNLPTHYIGEQLASMNLYSDSSALPHSTSTHQWRPKEFLPLDVKLPDSPRRSTFVPHMHTGPRNNVEPSLINYLSNLFGR